MGWGFQRFRPLDNTIPGSGISSLGSGKARSGQDAIASGHLAVYHLPTAAVWHNAEYSTPSIKSSKLVTIPYSQELMGIFWDLL